MTEPEKPKSEAVPEPEEIVSARKIIADITKRLDAGEVEAISVYLELRDGCYQSFQSPAPGRHEDAGRMMELMMLRLGFIQRSDLPQDE